MIFVPVIIVTGIFVSQAQAVWYNSSWSYRKSITIDNTGSPNTLTDYQVLVTLDTASLISAGKMRSDCGDIRFTDSDGSALINYWLESGCNTASTRIWVKVSSIPASSTKTVYVYYNNASAASTSSGNNTFYFFDDFETFSGWTTYGSGVVTQSSEQAYQGTYSAKKDTDCDSNGAYKLIGSTLNLADGYAFEGRFYREDLSSCLANRLSLEDGSYNGYGLRFVHNSDPASETLSVERRDSAIGTSLGSATYQALPEYSWYGFRFSTKSGGNYEIQYLGSGDASLASQSATDVNYSSFDRVCIRGGYPYYVDLLKIRKYNSPEPVTSIGSEENSGETIFTWTGTSSTDWNTAGNWDMNAVPGAGDTVVIPDVSGGSNRYPVLGSAAAVTNLTINSGATLTAGGNNLTVSSTFSNSGTLVLQGGETVSTPANNSGSLVQFNGTTGFYTLKNWTYYSLRLSSSSATTYNMPAALTLNGSLTIDANNTLDTTASNYNLNVAGNWTSSGTFTHNSGTVNFNAASTGKTITSGGSSFYNIVFNSSSGGWTLQDALTTTNNFTVSNSETSGNGVNLNGKAVNVTGNVAINGGKVAPGSSIITVGGSWNSSAGTAWTPGSSTVILSGSGNIAQYTTSAPWNYGFNKLSVAAAGTTTTLTSGALWVNKLTVGNGTFTDGPNSYGVLLQGSGDVFVDGGANLQIANFYYRDGGGGQNVVGRDYSGVTTLYFYAVGGSYGNNIYTLTTGNLTANNIEIYPNNGPSDTNVAILNTNGYNITASSLKIGNSSFSYDYGRLNMTGSSQVNINGNVSIATSAANGINTLSTGSGTMNVTGNVANNSAITISTGTLDIDGNFTVGTLTASGAAIINVAGNWSGVASFTPSSSIVTFNGSGAQSITSNGQSFNAITITNSSSGGVTFADALSTATLTDTTNGSTLKFATTGTHSVTGTLTLTGGTGSNMIKLEPVTASTNWNFSPPASTTVTGVNVSYSQSDKTITANSSNNGGNNNNWVFGAVTRYWVGVSSGEDWDDNGNWSNTSGGSGGYSYPVSGDMAIFDGSNTNNITLDAAVTTAAITNTGGYTGTFTTSNNSVNVSGNFTWNGGTFTAGSSTITVGGDWNSSGGTFNIGTSTITLTGVNKTISGVQLYNVNISSGADITSSSYHYQSGLLTISGTLTQSGNYWELAVAGTSNLTVNAGGLLKGSGTLIRNVGDGYSHITNNGTININEFLYRILLGSTAAPITATTYGGSVRIQDRGAYGNVTGILGPGGDLIINGTLTIEHDTPSGSYSTTLNNSNNLNISAGGLILGKTDSQRGSLITGSGSLDINGDVSIINGNGNSLLNASAGPQITVSGNWTNNDTFTAGTSTVTLDGTNQSISGDNTFYNLTKTVTTAATLTFQNSKEQIITNALTLQGASGQLLSLRSDSTNNPYNITLQAGKSRSLSYLDVKDSDASGGQTLAAGSYSTNSGNNSNWTFKIISVVLRDAADTTDYTTWNIGSGKTTDTAYIMNAGNAVLIKNDGNVSEDFSIQATGTNWTLGSATGVDTCVLMGLFNGNTAPAEGDYNATYDVITGTTAWATQSSGNGTFEGTNDGDAVAAGTGEKLYIYLKTPSSISSGDPETITVTIGAREH